MAEPNRADHHHHPEKEVNSPNLIERAREGIEAAFHHKKSPRHHKETHGTSDDIDENTPVDEIKAPNVFERVKEEVEAIVGSIHRKKDSEDHKAVHRKKSPGHHKETHGTSDDINENTPVDEIKAPNVFERVKEEVEAIVEAIHHKKDSEDHKVVNRKKSPGRHNETHGTSDDIDENTPVDEIKAPNVFERVKEEVEAVVGSIHHKTDSEDHKVVHRKKSPGHHKEAHGTSDDIDENTPVDEIKAPNVFERVKEEVEAIVEAIHHKKDSGDHK